MSLSALGPALRARALTTPPRTKCETLLHTGALSFANSLNNRSSQAKVVTLREIGVRFPSNGKTHDERRRYSIQHALVTGQRAILLQSLQLEGASPRLHPQGPRGGAYRPLGLQHAASTGFCLQRSSPRSPETRDVRGSVERRRENIRCSANRYLYGGVSGTPSRMRLGALQRGRRTKGGPRGFR